MRIVMVGPFAWSPKGTVSARAFFMGRALVQSGHQVTIIMPPYDHPAQAGYRWVCEGVDLINTSLPSWGDSVRARLEVPLDMMRQVIGLKPDLVHVFKPIGYSGLSGMALRLLRRELPLVIDCDDWEGRGGWADTKPYPAAWRWFLSWQEEWLARRVTVVTVASRLLQTRVLSFGKDPDRVFYLPNGPDHRLREQHKVSLGARRQTRQTLGVGEAPVAVYVGHISYGGEVNLVVDMLPRVLETAPEFRVVIIGSGDGIEGLQQRAASRGLLDRLIFVGWVDQRRLPAYLAAADLALYPFRDSLINRAKSPSKVTAYMAMGLPIVASAVGEVIEYLDYGRAGVLVDPENENAFGAAVTMLWCDPAKRRDLGRRARARIWKQYDWMQRIHELEQVYRTAMNV